MKSRHLLPLAGLLLLTACPSGGGLGILGNTNLNAKLLAVTSKDVRGLPNAKVYLSWEEIAGAQTYKVSGKVGTDASASLAVLTRTERRSFEDSVQPDVSLTYRVAALDAASDVKAKTDDLVVSVLNSQATAPSELSLNGTPIISSDIRKTDEARPTLSWSAVAGDNLYYYVKVVSRENAEEVVYAALTKGTSIKLSSLENEKLTLLRYPQVKDRALSDGKNYFYTVTTLRADNADLNLAKAVDVAVSEPREIAFRSAP